MRDGTEEWAFTIQELYAMSDKQLGDLLGSVVFIMGFNIPAARVVHAAAQRLRQEPESRRGSDLGR